MNKLFSQSLNRTQGVKNQSKSQFQGLEVQEPENSNWVKVLFEILIKILTLGFYHLERHRKK